MKRITILTTVFLLSFITGIFATITSGIIAYPVPYNPDFGVLKIEDKSGYFAGNLKVDVTIFDVNGDKVFSRIFPAFPAIWNGRNEAGKKVSSGFYIIKIDLEDANGFVGNRIIRILVNH